MLKLKMLIGGKWVEALSGKTYRAINPATCEEAAEIPLADSADVDRAVEAARQAFPVWSRKSQAERSDLIWKMSGLLKEHEEEINRIEVLDHGTPIKLARIQRHISSMNLEYAAQASRSLMGSALPYGFEYPVQRTAGTDRRLRADHPVELALDDGDFENGRLPGHGKYVRYQAVGD